MTFWQRAITIIVLMVFTPVSVLAGTPLRLCVGDDGHRAIEFVLSAAHHSDSEHAAEPSTIATHTGGTVVSGSAGCSDTPLISVAKKPSRIAPGTLIPPLDDLPTFVPPAAPTAVVSFLAETRSAGAQDQSIASGNPRLDALRTIVLLI